MSFEAPWEQLLLLAVGGRVLSHGRKRVLPMQEAVSVLDFCLFLQAVVCGSGIFPTVLPVQHLASYRKTVKRLIEAGEFLHSHGLAHGDAVFLLAL